MIDRVIQIRKIEKQEYIFYLTSPENCQEDLYLESYIWVKTPENFLGFTDIVLFENGKGYTLHRPLTKWKMQKLEKIYTKLCDKFNIKDI